MKDKVIALVNKARKALSKLAAQPWFPNRKVIAGAIAAAITQFLSVKIGIDLASAAQGALDGAVGAAVAYLIPERPSATLNALSNDIMAVKTALVPGPGGSPVLATPPPNPAPPG